MNNNFTNTELILTSQFPEAFLNFTWDSGDTSVWYIQPMRIYDISSGYLYVNGFDINATDSCVYSEPSVGYSLIVNFSGDPSIAAFHIFSPQPVPFETTLTFNVYANASTSIFESYDVSIYNKPFNIDTSIINFYETTNILVDDESSYGLLRTNPKFTGNVKIVIDVSNNIHLDTFKVSDPLNHKKFRHQKVSSKGILSNDIRRVFETLPIGEMYKTGNNNTLDISIPKTEYKQQFETEYIYGTRLLTDDLYTEKFSLLAPLWINTKLPDYFCIFKLDTVYNPETYDLSGLDDLAKKFISDSTILHSFSLQRTTPLGEYLLSHLNEFSQFKSPVFLSLSNPAQLDPDPNTWYGIAIDKGIVTGRSEIPFFFDKTTSNFTKTNAFISEGFERNNLLCSNLLNLEYVFNDINLSDFQMQRYFGLYLSNNPLYKIAYYSDSSTSSVNLILLDDRDPTEFFDSAIFGYNRGDIITKYANRIFALTHEFGVKRFTNAKQITGFNKSDIEEFLNKPDKNILSASAKLKTINPYVSLHINNVLQQGEHLRIINKSQNTIWEIYGIKNDLLGPEEAWTYASSIEPSAGYPKIYRNLFSTLGTTSDQAISIKNAFNVFSNHDDLPFDIVVSSLKNNIVSIILNDSAVSSGDVYQFQRLTAQTRNDPSDSSTPFNNTAQPGDICFYEYFVPTEDCFETLTYDSSFGPIDFELFGDRKSLTLNFLDTSEYNLYSLNKSFLDLFQNPTLYLSSKNDRYKKILDINTSALNIINNTVICAISTRFLYDPLEDNSENMFVITNELIALIGDIFNGYSIYPVNISLMGINNVKDLDFTVYDSSTLDFPSNYWYNRSDDPSTYILTKSEDGVITELNPNNHYVITDGSGMISIGGDVSVYSGDNLPFKFNTFFTNDVSIALAVDGTTTITINQLDGSKAYTSYIAGKTEEDINDYYVDASTKKLLKYSLTVPQISKWSLLGKDVRGNDLRIMLDSSIIDGSTNFIPYGDDYIDEISYPVFKYLGTGDTAWKNYIYTDINDSITYINDSSVYQTSTIKDYMFDNPTIDVFSKIIYSSKSDLTTSRSTIGYFRNSRNDLNFTISGLNLSLSIIDEARNLLDEKDWDKFRISFISTPSRNRTTNKPIEVIINENFGTILIIWYQGSDDLNYNRRYSTSFSSKNFLETTNPVRNFNGMDQSQNADKSNVKTPFFVRTDSTLSIINNIYGISDIGYDSSTSSGYAQFNYNYGDSNFSIFGAYGGNTVTSINVFQFAVSWNTFLQEVDYLYLFNDNTISSNSYNWAYKINSKENFYANNTTNLNTLKYILNTSRNNVQYYVLRNESIISHGSFNNTPLKITVNEPRLYTAPDSSSGVYTYNGWIKPIFNNILNFNSNEEIELINVVKKDFILGNTSLNSYNSIPQYWYNKITETVDASDLSDADAVNYITNYNPFLSLWDKNYFIRDGSLYNGTVSTKESPSFFGSKVINLPRTLELNTWYETSIDVETDIVDHTFKFNITRSIINLFKNNNTFIDNWLGLDSDVAISIDGYIRDTIVSYYNISIDKIQLIMWTKSYDGVTRLALELDDSFEQNEAKNIMGQLTIENGDYIYIINEPLLPNLSYFFSIELIEK